jgi:hypothetical protein
VAPEKRTYDVPEFASRLGISTAKAYALARETGAIAGVPIIRVGARMLVPRALADRVLDGGPTPPVAA